MRRALPRRLIAAAFLLAPVPGMAAVPSPVQSEVAQALVACPAGDLHLRVVVRDPSRNPVANSTVMIQLLDCAGIEVADPPGAGITWDPVTRILRAVTDGTGAADVGLAAGGRCGPGTVNVYADGVLLATRTAFATTDPDGDLHVKPTDARWLEGRIGAADPSIDLDGDGAITTADLAILDAHRHHRAQRPHGRKP